MIGNDNGGYDDGDGNDDNDHGNDDDRDNDRDSLEVKPVHHLHHQRYQTESMTMMAMTMMAMMMTYMLPLVSNDSVRSAAASMKVSAKEVASRVAAAMFRGSPSTTACRELNDWSYRDISCCCMMMLESEELSSATMEVQLLMVL